MRESLSVSLKRKYIVVAHETISVGDKIKFIHILLLELKNDCFHYHLFLPNAILTGNQLKYCSLFGREKPYLRWHHCLR